MVTQHVAAPKQTWCVYERENRVLRVPIRMQIKRKSECTEDLLVSDLRLAKSVCPPLTQVVHQFKACPQAYLSEKSRISLLPKKTCLGEMSRYI